MHHSVTWGMLVAAEDAASKAPVSQRQLQARHRCQACLPSAGGGADESKCSICASPGPPGTTPTPQAPLHRQQLLDLCLPRAISTAPGLLHRQQDLRRQEAAAGSGGAAAAALPPPRGERREEILALLLPLLLAVRCPLPAPSSPPPPVAAAAKASRQGASVLLLLLLLLLWASALGTTTEGCYCCSTQGCPPPHPCPQQPPLLQDPNQLPGVRWADGRQLQLQHLLGDACRERTRRRGVGCGGGWWVGVGG